VDNPEPISSRVYVLVRNDAISFYVNVALDLSLLVYIDSHQRQLYEAILRTYSLPS